MLKGTLIKTRPDRWKWQSAALLLAKSGWNVSDLAIHLKLKRQTIYRWLRTGKAPGLALLRPFAHALIAGPGNKKVTSGEIAATMNQLMEDAIFFRSISNSNINKSEIV